MGTNYLQPTQISFEPPNGEAEFARISAALTALVQSRAYHSVGAVSDAITRVVNARISGALEYLQEIYAGQSPEEGFTGFALLAANTDPRAMAIYFYAGRVGFLLIPGDTKGGRRIAVATQREFVDTVTENYGIVLAGQRCIDQSALNFKRRRQLKATMNQPLP